MSKDWQCQPCSGPKHGNNLVTRRLLQAALVSILLTYTALARAANDAASWASIGLKGKVRQLTESDLADNIAPSEPKGTPFHIRTTRFSPQGNAVSFDDCVSSCDRAQFFWLNGFLSEVHRQFSNGLREETVKYVRGPEGELLETRTYSGDELQCVRRYIENGLYTEETEFCPDVLKSRRVTQRLPASRSRYVSSHDYQEDGLTVDSETHHEDRSEQLENGTVRTERTWEGSSNKECWTEDAGGQLLDYISEGKTSYTRLTYQYDESGREIEKSEWGRDGGIINRRTYAYVVNEEGDWIRRTEFFWSNAMAEPVPGEVTVRAIEYY